ncbi:unnamed protein product [Onchocerca flexuosa]|uniref:Saposin B-type domain-containing protein n=1 Tax=Onchocerca flexuosa TaxID=387005 RepID=A0A183HVK2_9BILA|nr:unnamed protein product [Onchocerca flexuosa]
MCQSLAKQFREEILYVVDKLILQPNALCSMLITKCKNLRPDTSSWDIMLPPKRPDQEYPTYPALRQDNLRVLHITDLHLDPEYAPGSEANCSSELCCHRQPELNVQHFKFHFMGRKLNKLLIESFHQYHKIIGNY